MSERPPQTYRPSVEGHPEPEEMLRGRLQTARAIKDFATAGNAILTVRSVKTGTRFTYRIQAPQGDGVEPRDRQRPIWFVALLVGKDNETDYKYMGQIRDNLTYDAGKPGKRKIEPTAPGANGFAWLWNHVIRPERNHLFGQFEVWHEGRCGRCGRRLTVPESIESGFGPDCAEKLGISY